LGSATPLRGGNSFRAKAYARAADNLLALSLPLDQVIAQDRLREIPGVGDAIADIVKKLHATETRPHRSSLGPRSSAAETEKPTAPRRKAALR
jgi:DNA polymerase (family 10)